jgi:hypothetical protein
MNFLVRRDDEPVLFYAIGASLFLLPSAFARKNEKTK